MPSHADALFSDRADAGQQLAARLSRFARDPAVLVLALPRGGVPVGAEVASALRVPLDVLVVRKLGVPGDEELAFGAIASGGLRVLNHAIVDTLGIGPSTIQAVVAEQTRLLTERERALRGERPFPSLRGKTVIVVDDGIATGATMRAAVGAIRAQAPGRVVVATPVATREAARELGALADEVVCVETPDDFVAIGRWYDDFAQVSDAQAVACLRRVADERGQVAIDLNVDCGEGVGGGASGDAAILPHVSSANIACGGHAGDTNTMRETLRLCRAFGVSPGAHPGYPDRENFGRRALNLPLDQVYRSAHDQIATLANIARDEGMTLAHMKAHGAIYNQAAQDARLAEVLACAVCDVDPQLVMFGLANSALLTAGREAGLQVASEAFADRAYEADGSLRARSLPGAVIEDDERALAQALDIVLRGEVTAYDRSRLNLRADTICLHGDTPGAPRRASVLRRGLERAGVLVRPVRA